MPNPDLGQRDASYVYGDDYYYYTKDSRFPNNYYSYTTDSIYNTITLIQQVIDTHTNEMNNMADGHGINSQRI